MSTVNKQWQTRQLQIGEGTMASNSDDARLGLNLDDSALNISDMDEENGTGFVRSKRGKYAARMDKSVIQEFLLEWEKEGDEVWDLYPNVKRRTASTWRKCKDVVAAQLDDRCS